MGSSRGQSRENQNKKSKRRKRKKKKLKREKTIEVKKIAEECEIYDEKEEAVRSEKEAKKLVPERFHK